MLIAAVTFAARHGYDRHAGGLALALETFLLRRGCWHDLAETQRTALDVAIRGGDRTGQAREKFHAAGNRTGYATDQVRDKLRPGR